MTEKQISCIKNTICVLCLSINRKLYSIENEKLVQLINIQIFQSERICFECNSIIAKISSFRANAMKARTILGEIYKNLVSVNTFAVTSFSRLKTSKLQSYGILPEQLNSISNDGSFDQDIKPNANDLSLTTAYVYEHVMPIKNEVIDPIEMPISCNNVKFGAQTIRKTEATDVIGEIDFEQTATHQSCTITPSNNYYSDTTMTIDSKCDLPEKHDIPNLKKPIEKTVSVRPLQSMKDNRDNHVNDSTATSSMNVEETLHCYSTVTNPRELPTLNNKEICSIEKITREEVLQYREKKKNSKKYRIPIFKCEKCIEVYPTENNLENHLIKHTESYGPFLCDICDLRFRSSDEAEDHKYKHYTRFQCCECDFDTDDRVQMIKHFQLMHEIDPKDCDTCGVPLMTKYLYLKHIRQKHKVKPLCNLCGAKCGDYESLKHHVMLHKEVPELECPICFKKYKGTWGLQYHLRKIHKDSKEDGDDTYYCDECNVQFKNFQCYKSHLETTLKHIKDKEMKYKCTECDKKFIKASYLKSHMNSIHTSTETFECSECDKAYNTHKSLKAHIRRIHEKIPRARNHVCEFCAKAFTHIRTLNDHRNTHLGRRPYICNVCGDTFSFCSALYIHTQLKHLKVKRKKSQKKTLAKIETANQS